MEFELEDRLCEELRAEMTVGRRSFLPVWKLCWTSLCPGVLTLREQGRGGRREDTLGKVSKPQVFVTGEDSARALVTMPPSTSFCVLFFLP